MVYLDDLTENLHFRTPIFVMGMGILSKKNNRDFTGFTEDLMGI
jgi:hypothetical protein